MKKKKLILGCQTFGSSLVEKDCISALNICIRNNIMDFDLAESYPFPESDKTFGKSENIFKRIIDSAEKSLERLNTDYLDTYYLHWPDRYTNIFGRKYYNPDNDPIFIPLEEQFEAFYKLKKSGKIINYGLCNETPWGIMKFLELSKKKNFYPAIQEEYSILNRNIELSIKEIISRENLILNTYSPLSGGLLTGKYFLKNDLNWRLNKYKKFTQRNQTKIKKEIAKKIDNYCKKRKVNLIDVSIGFIKKQQFVSNVIFGISSIQNLHRFIKGWNFKLNDKIYKEVVKLI
jgi:aryl-alcohol dehydrogenase-like predicted oxidoreductase